MICSEFEKYLDDYCRGLLNDEQVELVESHIADCERCAAMYREHYSLLSLLAKQPEQTIEPGELADFLPGVWEKIQARPRISFKAWVYRLVPAAAIAAVLAFMIVKPSIQNNSIKSPDTEYTGAAYEGGLLFSESYSLDDQDSLYTDDNYFSLLDDFFADDLESLEILENELYTETGFWGDGSYELEQLSDESLELLDQKLDEFMNNAG